MTRARESSSRQNSKDTATLAQETADAKCDDSSITAMPSTKDQATGLLSLVERLELALERAPAVISEDQAGTAELETQRGVLKRQFAGLEQACARAEEVQLGLTDFVGQLAEVGDTAQEKISLLMDSLDAGNKARHELTKTAREVSDLVAGVESRISAHEKRLSEATDTYLAKVKRTHETQLAEIKRTYERDFEPFGIKGEQTLRLTELVESGIATINREADKRERKLVEKLETQMARYESRAREFEKRLEETAARYVATVKNTQEKTAAELKQEVEQQLAPFASTGEHVQRLTEIANRGVASIANAQAQSVRKLEETAGVQTAQFNDAADTKMKQLASQLQASREAVRMLSESTAEGHRVLSALIDKHEAVESQIRKIDERSENASRATDRLGSIAAGLEELQAKAEPAAAALKECMEGSQVTIDKIERLIQDVWTLTTTAQGRARQVSERTTEAAKTLEDIRAARQQGESWVSAAAQVSERARADREALERSLEQAGDAVGKVNASVVNASGVSERIVEETDIAGELVCDLGTLTERAEKIMEQVEAVCDTASHTASSTVQAVGRAEATTAALAESLKRADNAVSSITGEVREADAAVERVANARQSARATVQELERSSADRQAAENELRIAVETARQIAKDLAEALSAGSSLKEELTTATAGASDAHCEITQAAGELVGNLETLIERSEKTMRQMETICESASKTASQAVQGIEHAEVAASDALAESVKRTESAVTSVNSAVKEADQSVERIASSSQSARETARELETCQADQQAAVDELRSAAERGTQTAKDLAEALSAGSSLKEEITTATAGANEANRETAQLLAAIVERRDLLASSQQAINQFMEQSEALRIKWQRLETRADAFGHQLNSMLSDPAKIVEEAKSQADQLDRVCKAVRKIFAGLSQTSLQANRDVSRFGQISREANGRLAQISAETKRATQTLREWVEEASHAQSRLSRSLAQVPTISQTHPTTALEDLRRVSSGALSDILRPGASQLSPPVPQKKGQRVSTPDRDKHQGRRDLAALIQEAEQAAEANR